MLAWRGMPSSASATSMSRCSISSPSYMSRRGFDTRSASFMVMFGPMGMAFATASASP